MTNPAFWILTAIEIAIILFVVSKVRAARRVSRLPKEVRIGADPATVAAAAANVVGRLKYRIVEQDEGRLKFKTGLSFRSWTGQTMTATIQAAEDGAATEVRIEGHRNPSFQLYDWHESDRIAQRFLHELSAELREGAPESKS